MPFKPGQSGNPAGRPQTNKFVVELARQHTEAAINKLAELMNLEDEDSRTTQAAAAKALLDRAWGTPPQSIQVTGEEGGPVRVVSGEPLTPEQWAAKYAAVDSVGSATGTTESPS